MGQTMVGRTPPAGTFIFLQGNYVRVRLLTLWESEALCRFHSTFGQIRNHSPVCKPPVLQDIGNLDQETTVTHTLTSLSLTPRSLELGIERLQNMETVLLAQVCAKPHTPDDHRPEEGLFKLNIFKRNLLFPRRLCSPNIMFSSVAQSCLTLCDPMNCSMPGLPVHHQLLDFTQTHVHRVSDAIQPSHPLLSPSPPAPNPSQHHSLFQ